ncbi:hypothetical protein ACLBXM_06085 [Xanthobacteraceae bacterium A53D]
MSDTVWAVPPEAAFAVMPRLLAAADITELWAISEPVHEAHARLMEARLEVQLDAMGDLGKRLRREMRPGLLERLRDLWDRLTGRLRVTEDVSGVGLFAFHMPLAITRPPEELDRTADELADETRRLREVIEARISAERGVMPLRVHLPDTALDFMDEDDWTLAEEQLAEIATISAYWPPVAGKPALALVEQCEDAGLPTEVRLLAHDALAHDAMAAAIRTVGGSLAA